VLSRRRQEGALPADGGVHEGGIFGRPGSVNLANDAVMNAIAALLYTRADETGQHLHLSDSGRAEQDDTVIGQVALIVEGSGVAKVARGEQSRREAQALTVAVAADRRFRRAPGRVTV
jgi:hypothetical protein